MQDIEDMQNMHVCIVEHATRELDFDKVLQIKQILPIWDAMRSCFNIKCKIVCKMLCNMVCTF